MLASYPDLKIVAICEIFVVSALSFYLPFFLRFKDNVFEYSTCFMTFYAGILLGLGIIHLLGECIEEADAISDYPVLLVLFIVGILITLTCEQLAIYFAESKQSEESAQSCAMEASLDEHLHEEMGHSKSVKIYDKASHEEDTCDGHNHSQSVKTLKSLTLEPSLTSYVKAIMLEFSISIHSIIIGFDLGVNEDLFDIRMLMVVFVFHQYFEGHGLGASVIEANFNTNTSILFGLWFSLTVPIGIIIGLFAAGEAEGSAGVGVKACANAIAAGIISYVAMFEVLAPIYVDKRIRTNPILNMKATLCLYLGVSVMAVIAIWA